MPLKGWLHTAHGCNHRSKTVDIDEISRLYRQVDKRLNVTDHTKLTKAHPSFSVGLFSVGLFLFVVNYSKLTE